MAAEEILTELHGRRIGLTAKGNLKLNAPVSTGVGNSRGGLIGQNIPSFALITAAPGAAGSNISNVTIQMQDNDGNNVAQSDVIDVWLSDAASGQGLTGTTASGGIAAAAGGGAILSVGTTSKSLQAQPNTSGAFVLAITDTAKTGFYVAAAIAGRPFVSAQMVSANYG